jgi:uncharacterized protein
MNSNFKIIFSGITGSRLYGTATEFSDTDIRGVFIASEEYYLGFLNHIEQIETKEPNTVMFEISKFIKLCLEGNPNIIELLFVPPEYAQVSSDDWHDIIDNKSIFLSTKIKYTFSGYAASQLHRIKQHRNWLLNPPSHRPTRKEFNLPETNVITKDQINAYDELLDRGEILEIGLQTLQVLQSEKAYFNAMRHWEQYNKWKNERNKDRATLEAKFGFDTKHCSHLVRLLNEGLELLTTGNITFPRPDAEELLNIRNGKYTYEQIIEKYNIENIDLFFKQHENVFILPHDPDRKAGDLLCRKLIKKKLGFY